MSADEPNPTVEEDELDPDEPRTPLWLPLAGLALFLAAGLYFLLDSADPAAPLPQASEVGADAGTD